MNSLRRRLERIARKSFSDPDFAVMLSLYRSLGSDDEKFWLHSRDIAAIQNDACNALAAEKGLIMALLSDAQKEQIFQESKRQGDEWFWDAMNAAKTEAEPRFKVTSPYTACLKRYSDFFITTAKQIAEYEEGGGGDR